MTVTREELQAAIADTIDRLVDLTIDYAAGQVHAAVVPPEQPQRGEPPASSPQQIELIPLEPKMITTRRWFRR